MCVAIEETPTSGRRALTQLISAARLKGSGSVAAPSVGTGSDTARIGRCRPSRHRRGGADP